MKLASRISSLLSALHNANDSGNTQWANKHCDRLVRLVSDHMPSGSGVDNGTVLDLTKSVPDRLVFTFSFHHMSEHGYYEGWSDYSAVVTPSLQFDFDLRITGRDKNGIKDYLHQTFGYALETDINTETGERADIEEIREKAELMRYKELIERSRLDYVRELQAR